MRENTLTIRDTPRGPSLGLEPVSKVRIDDPSQRESPGRRGRSPPLRPTLLEQALSEARIPALRIADLSTAFTPP